MTATLGALLREARRRRAHDRGETNERQSLVWLVYHAEIARPRLEMIEADVVRPTEDELKRLCIVLCCVGGSWSAIMDAYYGEREDAA